MLGNNAINQWVPEWGPYEYLNILDSLSKRGFHVISENRKPGVDDSVYVNRIVLQIDSLQKQKVKARNIIVLGASAGSNITLHVSARLKNQDIRYVVMGGCWPDTYKDYERLKFYGHFLSIIELTDPHGTCDSIFINRKTLSTYQEIKLNTGRSHGFTYKGYKAWIDPIVDWK
jgi:dienelactone hydrolase